MPKLSNVNVEDETIRYIFNTKIEKAGLTSDTGIKCIFNVCMQDMDLFANLKGNIGSVEEYLERWIKRYTDARKNNVYSKSGNPSSTLPDPVVDTIIQGRIGLDDDEVKNMRDAHRVYMYAEQIQGSILEAFIDKQLKPYGWHYCCGEIVKSVDFCHTTGQLLQIKNKYNTENSSSSSVRNGTSIKKWCRLGRPSNNKVVYNWKELCEIVNNVKDKDMESLNIGEGDYKAFVSDVMKANPGLFYIESNNYWANDIVFKKNIKLKHLEEHVVEEYDFFLNMETIEEDEAKEYLYLISLDYIHIPELKINIYKYLSCSDYSEEIEDYESIESSYYIFNSETNEEIGWTYEDILSTILNWRMDNYTDEMIEDIQCDLVRGRKPKELSFSY